MGKTGAIVGWIMILSLMGVVFGEMAYAGNALLPIRDTLIEGFSDFVTSITAPIASGVNSGRVTVRGVVISPYRGP